jgi:hypothetical protein
MDRVRFSLIAFFPAIWLLASGQSVSCEICVLPVAGDYGCVLHAGNTCGADPICSPGPVLRPVNARIAKHLGKAAPHLLQPACLSDDLDRFSPAISFGARKAANAPGSWQLAYRTTNRPRAPSFLS